MSEFTKTPDGHYHLFENGKKVFSLFKDDIKDKDPLKTLIEYHECFKTYGCKPNQNPKMRLWL